MGLGLNYLNQNPHVKFQIYKRDMLDCLQQGVFAEKAKIQPMQKI
ncbi:hypothetical protein J535_0877 [Acinetobacter baumannii 1429530]|nr:hypothetical protein J535_0877 [Acinetobacter baumannii 1429530]